MHFGIASASDLTSVGRHVAVVALDGVCEQALHVAADELGVVSATKDRLLDLHSKVAQKLDSRWSEPGSKGVIELHRARNNVQHHGVLPDADHLPIWISDVDRYVHSLIQSTFGVALGDVYAADLVADPKLRQQLQLAEGLLAAGNYNDAFKEVYEAMQAARVMFKRHRAGQPLNLGRSTEFQEFRTIERSVQRLDDFIEVAYLATDPSEWLWLQALDMNVRGRMAMPTDVDVRRAFAFVLSWILRLDAFVARQPVRTVVERHEADLDVRYDAPSVVSVTGGGRQKLGRREQIRLEVKLAGVPPEWMWCVGRGQNALRDAGKGSVLGHTQSIGDTKLLVVLNSDAKPSDAQVLITAIVARTHKAFNAMLEARRELRRRQGEIAATYARDLADKDSPYTSTGVTATCHDWPHGPVSQVRIPLALPDDVDRYAVMDALPWRAHIDPENGLVVDPSEVPAPGLPGALADAVNLARASQEEAERREQAATQQYERLVADLEAWASKTGSVAG